MLDFWSGELHVAVDSLDADGLVVVPDPRAHAAERHGTMRTARGTWLLAPPAAVAAVAANPEEFAADVAARAQDDALFHYLASDPRRDPDPRVCALGAGHRPLLDSLQRAAGTEAAEEADVDVAHPLAVGIVERGRLLAIGSLLEEDARTVDVGVLVHPAERRRGLGVAVVAALAARAAGDGLLVQYRCRSANEASARLAHACGFALWGELTVAPRRAQA